MFWFRKNPSKPPAIIPPARPVASNENLRLLGDGITPAGALLLAKDVKARLRRENAHRGTLMSDAEQRRRWDEVHAFEQCIRWHYFRELPE